MVARTSTACAPWTLVAGNDKKFARIRILEEFRDRLKAALD
jgi:polyphosphate kinase 2 (PPK2 family)